MKFSITPLSWLFRFGVVGLAVLGMAGCPMSSGIQGSGKEATENRTVGTFSRISVEGSATLDTEIGANTTVVVTIDDNLLPLIQTKVEGDTLHIYSKESYNTSRGLKVKITTPTLDGVAVSGACNIHAVGLDSKNFELNISGAGDAHLTGKAEALAIQLSGAGSVEASQLVAKNVQVVISGAASAEVYASQSLDATVSGTGSVQYKGNPPTVRKNVSGVGSIGPK